MPIFAFCALFPLGLIFHYLLSFISFLAFLVSHILFLLSLYFLSSIVEAEELNSGSLTRAVGGVRPSFLLTPYPLLSVSQTLEEDGQETGGK